MNAQGGEAALMRLQPDGTILAGAVEGLAAEPTGCECGRCGTRYAPHQIRTGAPATQLSGSIGVAREVDCDFCSVTQAWVEGCTQAGLPNGRVLSGPTYRAIASPAS